MIKQGDALKFKKEYMDAGDDKIKFVARDDESKGRVTVVAEIGLPINPTTVLPVWMFEVSND